jgi:hypothetical protein
MTEFLQPSRDSSASFWDFSRHYWSAFVWVGLALLTAILLILLAFSVSLPSHKPDDTTLGLLVIGVAAALYRSWQGGWRFNSNNDLIRETGMEGFFLKVSLSAIQIGIATITWPLFEMFRQGRFLVKAWRAWKEGQILVDSFGKILRAG